MKNFNFRSEPHILDDIARTAAPGKFVKLSHGYTHYLLDGPLFGPVVVLVAGLLGSYPIWDLTVDDLTQAGFCVLRYDLWGRGYSDRPDIVYDYALFDQQLTELLQALNIQKAINLVGISMGGAIAAKFTALHTKQVQRLVLINPAGLHPTESLPWKLIRVPGFGEWLVDRFTERMVKLGLAKDKFTRGKIMELADAYEDHMQYQGYKNAVLSTLRHIPLDITETYQCIGYQKTPTLLIWGQEDKTIPYDVHKHICATIPQCEFHSIPETGHMPHYEKPKVVNPILLDFLRGKRREQETLTQPPVQLVV